MYNDTERKFSFEEIDRHYDAVKNGQGIGWAATANSEDTPKIAQETILHIREIKRYLSRLEREAQNVLRYNSGVY